jgi:predicted lipid-binding transport protein (Tim44 family)
MVRTIGGFAVLAVVAMLGFKLLVGFFGTLIGLVVTLLWWAFMGFVVYTLLKIFAPGLAQRIRDTIRGPSATT